MWSPFTCTDTGRALLRSVVLIGVVAFAASAQAAPLEKLLMPGKLTQAHAKYEDDCAQCHTSFSRAAEQQQCRACHDKIDADVRAGKGFHGLAPQAVGKECRACHSEHKGRDADIVGISVALFDHRLTDFALKGAHAKTPCKDCHADGKAWRDAPGQCIDCHARDDVHDGQMGRQCQDCHGVQSWRKSEFDHDKTRFPLRGGHRDAACASCHPDRRYEGTSTDCAACHGLEDRHGGLFGNRCADCHGTQSWASTRFDHGKTGFALDGRHQRAGCHSCHSESTRGRKLGTQCADCHRGSDVHQGRFGTKCESCHSTESWQKKAFDHDRDTAFVLRGPHRELACSSCHSGKPAAGGGMRASVSRTCVDCHRGDDVHRGQQGDRCDTCHQVKSWREGVRFDHDLTRFPLIGLHATVPCTECHVDNAYQATQHQCRACHQSADPHKGALGARCESCHSAAGWARWTFDHDQQTGFALEGRHAQAPCGACHREPATGASGIAKLERGCNSCHASDDAHRGGFGADCGRCHQPSAFTDVRIDRSIRGSRPKEDR